MKILAIDTVTEACSAAMSIGGEIFERYELAPQKHTELILPMVQQLLAEAEIELNSLDAIAFNRGPGSFTGARICCGVTQGLAFGADLPVVPVSSLLTVAHGAWRKFGANNVLAAIDARMSEVYYAPVIIKEQGNATLQEEEVVINPAKIKQPEGDGWYGSGSGWKSYADKLSSVTNVKRVDAEQLTSATDVAMLAVTEFENGLRLPAEQAQPLYLRNNVVRK